MATGDQFHDFYRAAYPRLVAQLYAVTADLAQAEDVVQEAFVRAASRWPEVRSYHAPEAWVRKVALRLRLDALRRVRRQAAALARLGARPGPEPLISPEDRELVEALRRLPDRYRDVLVLHHCLDQSVDDVAAHLGVPAATVKTRLARGRAKLASLLAVGGEPAARRSPAMSDHDLGDRLDHLLRTVAAGVAAGDPAAVARRGHRRRLARRAAGAAVVAALLVGVVLVSTVLPDRARRPATPSVVTGPSMGGIPDGVVSWSGARAGKKPQQLTVTVQAGGGAASQPSDPCWEGYQPEARSEPDRVVVVVVVTVRRFRSRVPLAEGRGCADLGLMWNVTVDLPDDLRGRQVVDGATGQPEEVVTWLLAPLWLPRGWGLLHETGGDGARWQREYGPKPGPTPSDSRGPRHPELLEPAGQMTVVEVPPRLLPTWNRWPDIPVVAHPVVRGFRAEVDWSQADRIVNLRWREGDPAYVVSRQARNGAELRGVQELVVAIAGGLRRPCEPPPLILDSYPPQFREADGGATPDQRGCR